MKWNKILCVTTCILFIGFALFFIQNDYWQDEIYTLSHFVFVPLKLTLTDYHVANNHILFSVLLNLCKHFSGLNSLPFFLQHPYYLRIVPLVFTVLTIVIFYFSIKSLFTKSISLIASSTLVTTFAFLNFSVQLRGYSLSIFIAVIQLHYFLKILKNANTNHTDIYKLALATLFSILCLPVNLYYATTFIISLIIIYLLPNHKKFNIAEKCNKPNILKLIFILFIIIGICLVYYYWLFSRTATLEASFPLKPFSTDYFVQFFAIIFHLVHYRIYFYVIVMISFYSFYKRYRRNKTISLLYVVPALIILLYFIICIIHGAVVIQRIFLVLIPVFALIISYSTDTFFRVRWLRNKLYIFFLLNFFTLIISFFVAAKKSVYTNKNSIHVHNLINHYYLFNYNAFDAVHIAKNYSNHSKTILFINEGFGDSGIKYYLQSFNIKFNDFSENSFINAKSFTVISNNKKNLEKELTQNGWHFKSLIDNKLYYNVYFCYKK